MPAFTSHPAVGGLALQGATILDAQRAFGDGALTSVALTELYLERIEAYNRDLNAIVFVNPNALREAEASDTRRRAGRSLGPLDGIPVVIKDNIETADMPTTVGSLALLDAGPTGDAEVVALLRKAGAVLLGKANMDVWAGYRSVDVVSGWSPVGGQTRNPYVVSRDSWGSSCGPAVAVSAHLAFFAIGAKTDGSLLGPAGVNGVVAIQPTVGLVSPRGLVPVYRAQDTAGPIARTVEDAALILSVIGRPGGVPVDASRRGLAVGTDPLNGKRIGVWAPSGGGVVLPESAIDVRDRILEKAIAALEARGTIIIRGLDLDVDPSANPALNPTWVGHVELKDSINSYLASRTGRHPRDLSALIDFGETHPEEMELFGHDELLAAQATHGNVSDRVWQAQRGALTRVARGAIDTALNRHDLAAIIAPTNTHALPPLLRAGVQTARLPARAGYPGITVPAGLAHGALPVGVSFLGRAGDEGRLLEIAIAFEQATQARQAPNMLDGLGPLEQ